MSDASVSRTEKIQDRGQVSTSSSSSSSSTKQERTGAPVQDSRGPPRTKWSEYITHFKRREYEEKYTKSLLHEQIDVTSSHNLAHFDEMLQSKEAIEYMKKGRVEGFTWAIEYLLEKECISSLQALTYASNVVAAPANDRNHGRLDAQTALLSECIRRCGESPDPALHMIPPSVLFAVMASGYPATIISQLLSLCPELVNMPLVILPGTFFFNTQVCYSTPLANALLVPGITRPRHALSYLDSLLAGPVACSLTQPATCLVLDGRTSADPAAEHIIIHLLRAKYTAFRNNSTEWMIIMMRVMSNARIQKRRSWFVVETVKFFVRAFGKKLYSVLDVIDVLTVMNYTDDEWGESKDAVKRYAQSHPGLFQALCQYYKGRPERKALYDFFCAGEYVPETDDECD